MAENLSDELKFKNLVEGLSDRELLQTAFQCGYIPQGPFEVGDMVTVTTPPWLTEILVKRGIVELAETKT